MAGTADNNSRKLFAQVDQLSTIFQSQPLGAAEDLDYALRILSAVKTGRLGPVLRVYRPVETMAFGQRDVRLSGFVEAQDVSRSAGYEPLVRKAGGRAAAYHPGCLVVDHLEPHDDAVAGSRDRFRFFGELLARALRGVGVNAAMGEIPGEYCPGEFSVHGTPSSGPEVKLVGTAQRIVAGAWMFSSVIVVENSAPIRNVLTDVYSALDLVWDTTTAGAAEDLVPGLCVEDVRAAVLDAYADYASLHERSWPWLTERVG
ncbi:lipoate--protein ligase family protein [Arthrobacter roseus]|uniref:lipoate--protein ligase family protein n=1 Tax=Arthrobacter roseus TaxID=136274 RepID=UPI001964E70E|nr:lipoate--protein ligase family protein [Arthrobacter roseus]MBM7848736.1 lipoate-protein ligase A [Arthrobacter roseus]